MRVTGPQLLETFKNIGATAVTSRSSFLDWHLATSIALDLSENHPLDAAERAILLDNYNRHVDAARSLIEEVTGSYPMGKAQVLVLERHEWITAMALSMEQLFADLEIERLLSDALEPEAQGHHMIDPQKHTFAERMALKTAAALGSTQIGVVLAFLSHKVLGQFDWSFTNGAEDHPRYMYFLEPNVSSACRFHGLDTDIFRQWVALHESVHVFQFNGHPWVREYLYKMLTEYVALIKSDLLGKGASPVQLFAATTGVKALTELSPQLRALFLRTQAFMAIVEGHADYLMAKAGSKLPNHQQYARVFLGKKRKKNLLDTLLGKMLGFDIKVMQYKLGFRFIDRVVRLAGYSYVERLWVGPENLPSYDELLDAALWIKRMDGSLDAGARIV